MYNEKTNIQLPLIHDESFCSFILIVQYYLVKLLM